MEDSIFDYVNKHANIKDVVSYFLGEKKLIRSGNNYKTLCPFHQDHDPSFSISVDKNIAKCFVCGNGGGPVSFVQKYLNVSAIDAVKKVVEICHIDLPNNFKFTEKQSINKTKFIKEINALTELSNFYSLYLNMPEGKICQDYLKKRNIDQDTINEFNLGYAPSDSSLSIDALSKRGVDILTMQNAGILNSGINNEDRFSNRLIFPLKDEDGNIIAFAGRQLIKDDTTGKYINYPETSLFHKSDIFYNLDKAKSYAYKEKCIYIVEGYMDSISMYKAGIKNVIACMTSAINENQIKILKRLNVQVRLLLDSDSAGQEGIKRNLIPLLKNNIDCAVVRKFDKELEGKDPDEVLNNKGKEYLIQRVKKIYDPFLFIIADSLNGERKISSPLEIKNLIQTLKNYYPYLDQISKVKDLEVLSRVTSVSIDELTMQFNNNVKISSPTIENYKKSTKYKRKEELIKEEKREIFSSINDKSDIYVLADTANKMTDFCFSSSTYKCTIKKNILKEESSIILQIFSYYDAYLTLQETVDEKSGDKFEFSYYPYYYLNLLLKKMYDSTVNKKINKETIDSFIEELKINSNLEDDENDDDPFLDYNPYKNVIEQLNASKIPLTFIINILDFIKNSLVNNEFAKKEFKAYLLKLKNRQDINMDELKKPAKNAFDIQEKIKKMRKIHSK